MFLIALFNLMFDSYVLLLMSAHRLTHKFDQSLARKIYSLKAHRPPVSLEVWRANFSRSQKLFAFSVYTHSHTWSLPNGVDSLTRELTATSNNRNFLEEKSNYISTSRHLLSLLLQKVDRSVPVLFWTIDNYYRLVYIWVSNKFANSDPKQRSFLLFAYPRQKEVIEADWSEGNLSLIFWHEKLKN